MFFFLSLLFAIVIMALMRFETPDAVAADSEDFSVPKTSNSAPITVIFGTCKLEAPNVLTWGNLRTTEIKKEVKTGLFSEDEVTVGYRYFATFDMGLCWGPADLIRIEASAYEIWDGNQAASGTLAVDKRDIYGDEGGGEAGVFGNFSFYDGAIPIDLATDCKFTSAEEDYNQEGDPTSIYPTVAASDPASYQNGRHAVIFDAAATRAASHLNDDRRPTAPGVCRVMFDGYIGNTPSIRPFKFVLRHLPQGPDGTTAAWEDINGDANPAAIVYQVLANETYGLGLADTKINIQAIKDSMETLHTEGLGLSLKWTNDIPAEKFLNVICEHINATYYVDTNTGELTLELIRPQDSYEGLPVFDESNIIEISSINRPDTNDIVTELKVRYIDRDSNWKDNIAIANNTAAQYYIGRVISETQEFKGLSNATTALLVANRRLTEISSAPATVTLKATTTNNLNNGQLARIRFPSRGITEMIGRITKIDFGTLERPDIKITFLEDVFTIRLGQFASVPVSQWAGSPGQNRPAPVSDYQIIDLPPALSTEPAVHLRAEPPAGASAIELYRAESSTMFAKAMIGSQGPNAATTLTGAIARGDQTLAVAGIAAPATVTDADIRAGQNLALISDGTNHEWIAYHGGTTTSLTGVERGLFDTPPRDWNAGDYVTLVATGDITNPLANNAPAYLEVVAKGVFYRSTGNPKGLHTPNSTHTQPAPPEIDINSKYYPANITGDANLTVQLLQRDYAAYYLNQETGPTTGYTFTRELWIDGVLRDTGTEASASWTLAEIVALNANAAFTTIAIKAKANDGASDSVIAEAVITTWDDNGASHVV